jgi:tetratricopeptide (TPR) repeat protein
MGYFIRKTWVLAGVFVLCLGCGLIAVRGRRTSDPRKLAHEAQQALGNRQWSRAEALLDRLSSLRTLNSHDVLLRAELELGRGRFDETLRMLDSVPESDAHAAEARLAAGKIERSRHRARSAESYLIEACRIDPTLAAAHRELILIYAMQARRGDLNVQFRALAGLEPLPFDDVLLWTASLEDIWINETIRSDLEGYLAADPGDRTSRLALAAVLFRTGELDACESILSMLPDSDDDARVLRARLALGHMDLDRVRSLISQGPEDHLGLELLRGQLAARSNDPRVAVKHFQVASRLDPTNREAIQGIALMLKQLGNADEAAPDLRQAEQWRRLTDLLEQVRRPDGRRDGGLLRQLGETCESLQREAEARSWYRLALALDPLDSVVQRALYRLREHAP